ncbi:odorant receptor 4-like [Galleria mellonella]|uniref:Odorant receptor n=1 Tax=Galleria mellonella TaxID=7137 RepID=A0ABM3MIN1_GALME|nr:odorant receptor 4-like [Galleria mellonella]
MDETLQVLHRVLSTIGISAFSKNSWDTKSWFAFQIFNVIVGLLCFIFTTGFVITNNSNATIFIKGSCIWAIGVVMFLWLALCLIFRKRFRMLLEEMVFVDRLLDIPLINHVLYEGDGVKSIELKHLVNNTRMTLFKYIKMLLKFYLICVYAIVILYVISPIYEMLINKHCLRLLAFTMWFPWDLDNLYVYIPTFIYQVYVGNLCCIVYCGIQVMIILLIGQKIRHLRVLTFILLNLDELATEIVKKNKEKWQDNCTAVLIQCVDHYIKLKQFSNKLNTICRPFYLTLITVSITLVCLCSVKIAISDKLSLDTMKYYILEFCFILVVLVVCLLGQQVDNECEQLDIAVTEKWYIYNRQHKIKMRIFKMATGQRMPIYIFGTVTLSLPTFTWFIRTGMSFFTLVMSVIED